MPKPGISIVKLGISDLGFCEQLIRLWSSGARPSKSYLKNQLNLPNFHIYVVLEGTQVVGGLTAYELPMFTKEVSELFLYEIGIEETHQRKGLAKLLIDALKMFGKQHGYSEIFVGTSMDNTAARNLYSSTGGIEEISPWYTYKLNI